jgi:hypothetical protein
MPRRRSSREELHKVLLEKGREILFEEGFETDSNNLTFKRVFGRVEAKSGQRITNASVIKRVWENQAEHQTDVLVSIAKDEARPEVEGAVGCVAHSRLLHSRIPGSGSPRGVSRWRHRKRHGHCQICQLAALDLCRRHGHRHGDAGTAETD